MKFAVVILGLVVAVSGQFNAFNPGAYNPGAYNPGAYNGGQYNQYNRFNQYNPYNRNNYNQYRYNPYSTPEPFRYRPTTVLPAVPAVTVSPTPSDASPTPAPVQVSPVAVSRVLSPDYNAETLKFGNDNAPDGSFNYFYETSNGIAAQEQGVPRTFGGNPPVSPVVAQGSFSWTSPEGQPISISYVADENGYQPSGDAIPTPPAIPAQIARALDYIARSGKIARK